MENPNPEVSVSSVPDILDGMTVEYIRSLGDDATLEPVTESEVFSLIRNLRDPEHPELTLEQLKVVKLEKIKMIKNSLLVEYTPTIPTCSVATLIGLTIKFKLILCLPPVIKVTVRIAPGKHVQEVSVNKQLEDKERVNAAMENPNLGKMVREGIHRTDFIPDELVLW
jgi:hypothetical protein